tara:strand:- start:754 stop:1296 length:543 start_codon:yes stop_codon:yes gene_type:complete
MLTIIEGARNSGKTFLLDQLEQGYWSKPVFKFPFTSWFERLGLEETCNSGHCLGLGKEIMIHELNKSGFLKDTWMDRGIITALAWGVFQKRITQEQAMNQFNYFIEDGLFKNVRIIYVIGENPNSRGSKDLWDKVPRKVELFALEIFLRALKDNGISYQKFNNSFNEESINRFKKLCVEY